MFKRIRTQSYSPLNLGYFPVNPILVSFIFIICAYFLPRRPSPSPSLPQGFNTCLFCYGQTGTGKTTTIMGSAGGPWESLQWTGWANGLFFMSFVLMCFFFPCLTSSHLFSELDGYVWGVLRHLDFQSTYPLAWKLNPSRTLDCTHRTNKYGSSYQIWHT